MAVSRATRRQLGGFGAVVVALAAAALVFSPAAVLDSIAALSSSPWQFLGVLLALYLVRPFVLWPVSFLSLVAGFVYGVAYGIPVAAVGLLVSESIPFVVARRFRAEAGLLGLTSAAGDRVVAATGEVRGLVAARLAPVPSDVISSAAGLSDVSVRGYLAGSLVGESPWIVAAVVAGASMQTLSVDGLSHGVALVVGATAVSALLLAGPAYRFARDSRGWELGD